MSSSERRIDTRVNIRVPLRFRALNNPGATEQTAESENISQRGMYFMTNVPLKVGTPVEVSLRMPQELVGKVGERREVRGARGPRHGRAPAREACWGSGCTSSVTRPKLRRGTAGRVRSKWRPGIVRG